MYIVDMQTQRSRSVIKLPLEQAAAALYSLGVVTYSDFLKFCDDGLRPDFIPSSPHTYYPNWPGWSEFLDIGKAAATHTIIYQGVNYATLKRLMRVKGITTRQKYLQAFRARHLPPGTPRFPDEYFPEFEGWGIFLAPKTREIDYEAAKKLVHPLGLKSSYQWRNLCRAGKKPEGVPVLPSRDFKDFVSWADFLGVKD